jgi:hypothetical protein
MACHAGPADWWTDGTDDGRTHIATKGIVQDGIVLNLDAGVSSSYPGSGTTWSDLTSNGNDGTLTNGPTFDSANGGSIVFDGTNDYVDLSTQMFNPNSDFTISSWVNFDSLSGTHTIVSTQNSSGSFQLRYVSGSGVQIVDSYVINVGTFSSSQTLSTGTWYAITITRSGNTYTYYLDGSSVSSFTSTNSYNQGPRTIGVNLNSTEAFDGKISIIRAYNKALTAAEVEQNFNALRGRFGI